ncbi:unnamed protein product [Candidula unifasciata]|uniref:J domain-containing protein n=1 Tax=Candidula unifasciata TaxID=100452 RepID=A0A8S3ZHL5_9EUPU|nr:unnamed protein product [Candidula unifasciata]
MKSVLKFCKISHNHNWPKANCPLLPTSTQFPGGSLRHFTVPSLSHLAAARTLVAFVPKKTYYEVLGLSPSATTYEIRQAFLKLSKQCHPDVNTSDYDLENHKKFVQVNEAYSVLSRPLSRRDYDATLNTFQAHTTTAYPHYGYDQPDAGSYTYYKSRQNDTDWTKAENQKGGKILTSFFLVTSCLTCASVALILNYMHNYIPDPKYSYLRKSKQEDIQQHELIMTSVHDGKVIYYYAVPKADDPRSYEVLAVMKNDVKDSDMHELQELNQLNYGKQQAL